jgi:uncharacterized protein YtpQ (UPF0354 family)
MIYIGKCWKLYDKIIIFDEKNCKLLLRVNMILNTYFNLKKLSKPYKNENIEKDFLFSCVNIFYFIFCIHLREK